jgi:hypothetical protein
LFDNVVIGVTNREGGRDAVALARQLVSTTGRLTLVHARVIGREPSGDPHDRRHGLDALEGLREETRIGAHVSSVKALSVAHGLHTYARVQRADLIVVGAGASSVLHRAPCAVAIAPIGYASATRPLEEIAVAYDVAGAAQALADDPDTPLLVPRSAPQRVGAIRNHKPERSVR